MLIDFDRMEASVVPPMRGGEKEASVKTYADEHGKLLEGKLVPGATIGLHTHETSSEVIYILSGTGKILCDGVYEPLRAGSCHYCPKGHTHSLINDSEGELCFLAVVSEQ